MYLYYGRPCFRHACFFYFFKNFRFIILAYISKYYPCLGQNVSFRIRPGRGIDDPCPPSSRGNLRESRPSSTDAGFYPSTTRIFTKETLPKQSDFAMFVFENMLRLERSFRRDDQCFIEIFQTESSSLLHCKFKGSYHILRLFFHRRWLGNFSTDGVSTYPAGFPVTISSTSHHRPNPHHLKMDLLDFFVIGHATRCWNVSEKTSGDLDVLSDVMTAFFNIWTAYLKQYYRKE